MEGESSRASSSRDDVGDRDSGVQPEMADVTKDETSRESSLGDDKGDHGRGLGVLPDPALVKEDETSQGSSSNDDMGDSGREFTKRPKVTLDVRTQYMNSSWADIMDDDVDENDPNKLREQLRAANQQIAALENDIWGGDVLLAARQYLLLAMHDQHMEIYGKRAEYEKLLADAKADQKRRDADTALATELKTILGEAKKKQHNVVSEAQVKAIKKKAEIETTRRMKTREVQAEHKMRLADAAQKRAHQVVQNAEEMLAHEAKASQELWRRRIQSAREQGKMEGLHEAWRTQALDAVGTPRDAGDECHIQNRAREFVQFVGPLLDTVHSGDTRDTQVAGVEWTWDQLLPPTSDDPKPDALRVWDFIADELVSQGYLAAPSRSEDGSGEDELEDESDDEESSEDGDEDSGNECDGDELYSR
jgi:hypothetical protein